jgi:hypothetical protein
MQLRLSNFHAEPEDNAGGKVGPRKAPVRGYENEITIVVVKRIGM